MAKKICSGLMSGNITASPALVAEIDGQLLTTVAVADILQSSTTGREISRILGCIYLVRRYVAGKDRYVGKCR